MSRNELIKLLENSPSDQDLRDSLSDIIDYLKDSVTPCDCCRTKSRYGCAPGCQCRQVEPDICENCEHESKDHLKDGRCVGTWAHHGCPCKEFEPFRHFGDRG